jgi:hypothetical protein
MSEHVPDDFPINGPATRYLLDKITDRIDSISPNPHYSYKFGEDREPLSTFIDYVNLIINGGDFHWEVSNLFSDYGGEHDPDNVNDVFYENFEFSTNKTYTANCYVSSQLFTCCYDGCSFYNNNFKPTINLIYPYCDVYYKLDLYYTGDINVISDNEIKTLFDYSLENGYDKYIGFIITYNQHLYKNFYIDNINNYPKLLLYSLIEIKSWDNEKDEEEGEEKLYPKYFNIILNKLQIKHYKFFDYQLIKQLIIYDENINCNFDTLVNIAFINSEALCKIINNFRISGNIIIKTNLYNKINKNLMYRIHKNRINSFVKYLKSLYKDKNKIIIYRLHKRSRNGCKYSSDIIRKIKS